MKRNFRVSSDIVVVGLLLILGLALATGAHGQEKTIASRTAEVDGVRLQYLTAGKGPAVILLHGYAETSRMWKPLMPVLAGRFTGIAPGFPGIGDSAVPAGGTDMKTA